MRKRCNAIDRTNRNSIKILQFVFDVKTADTKKKSEKTKRNYQNLN